MNTTTAQTMTADDMRAWLAARGVGQPGYLTMTEALETHRGKTLEEMEAAYDEVCGHIA